MNATIKTPQAATTITAKSLRQRERRAEQKAQAAAAQGNVTVADAERLGMPKLAARRRKAAATMPDANEAAVLLRSRVEAGAAAPSEADALLLNAALHVEGREVESRSKPHVTTQAERDALRADNASRSVLRRKAIQTGQPVPTFTEAQLAAADAVLLVPAKPEPEVGSAAWFEAQEAQVAAGAPTSANGCRVGDLVRSGNAKGTLEALVDVVDAMTGRFVGAVIRKENGQTTQRRATTLQLLRSAAVDVVADEDDAAKTTDAASAAADDATMPEALVVEPTEPIVPADVRTLPVTPAQLARFAAVHSAHLVPNGQVEAIEFGGSLFTCTASADNIAVAHRLFTPSDFEMAFFGIEPRTYAATLAGRYKGAAFYFGMLVTLAGTVDGTGPEYVLGPEVQVVETAVPMAAPRKARTPRAPQDASEAAQARRLDAAKRYADRVTTFEVGARVKCYAAAKPTSGTVQSVQGAMTPTEHTVTILLDTGKTTTRLARTVTRVKA